MTSVGTRARSTLMPAVVCAACGALIFQFLGSSTRGYIGSPSLFYWWGFQWVNPGSETQHGLLILGISAWILVRNLRSEPVAPAPSPAPVASGFAAMLSGLALHFVGFVSEQARISILGLLLFSWGVARLAGGSRWGRAAAFPAAFLVLAIPLNTLDSIGFWLRMGVVGASARIAHAAGIGVLVNGTQLLSPDGRYNYDVAAACSGIRSLTALAALSVLVGYLLFRPRWLIGAMLLLCLPLVFFGNVARIVSIIVAAQLWGRAWGDRVHEVMGFGVFAIVLGGLLGFVALAGRLRPAWLGVPGDAPPPREPPSRAPLATGGWRAPWMVATAVTAASALLAAALFHVSRMPESDRAGVRLSADGKDPVELPTFLGTDWVGRRTEVTEVERQVLPPDTGFSRKVYVFLADPSLQVLLSIVLSGRDRTSIHKPEYCLVGQGWTIRGGFQHSFAFPGRPGGFPATVLRVERELTTSRGTRVVPQLFAYYFVGADSIVASHWQLMTRDSLHRILHGTGDRWAYVVIQTGDSDGDAAALDRIQAILNATLPVFQRHG